MQCLFFAHIDFSIEKKIEMEKNNKKLNIDPMHVNCGPRFMFRIYCWCELSENSILNDNNNQQ